jgi:hypothetical protein
MALGDAEGFQRRARVNLYFQAGENFLARGAWRASRAFQQAFIEILADENFR